MSSEKVDIIDINANERLHLVPKERLKVVAIISGLVGGFSGLYEGVKTSSLRYLAENGHRLPRNVGGWYFYHKRKNYIMILSGLREAAKSGFKFSFVVSGFFTLEFLIDKYLRNGTIDFMNTSLAATICSSVFAFHRGLSSLQTRTYIKKGFALGLSLGISQDLLIFSRGGHIWYIDSLGIKNPKVTSKLDA